MLQEAGSTLTSAVLMECLRCKKYQTKGDAGSKDPRAAWAINMIERQLQRGVQAWFCSNCCPLNYNECLTIKQGKSEQRLSKKSEKMIEEETASSDAFFPSSGTSSTKPNPEIEDSEIQAIGSSLDFLAELLNEPIVPGEARSIDLFLAILILFVAKDIPLD